MKVIRAFNILTGDVDYTKEKGYCSSLYDGIECCCIKSDSTIITNDDSKQSGSETPPIKLPTTPAKKNSIPCATITQNATENASETCDDTCTCATNMSDSTALNLCCNQPNNQHYLHNHVNDSLTKNHHHEHSNHNHDHDHNHDGHDEKSCSSSSSSSSSPCTSPRTCKHTIDTNKYKFHSNEQHLHLKVDKKFIADLIIRAEPEIQGRYVIAQKNKKVYSLPFALKHVLTNR